MWKESISNRIANGLFYCFPMNHKMCYLSFCCFSHNRQIDPETQNNYFKYIFFSIYLTHHTWKGFWRCSCSVGFSGTLDRWGDYGNLCRSCTLVRYEGLHRDKAINLIDNVPSLSCFREGVRLHLTPFCVRWRRSHEEMTPFQSSIEYQLQIIDFCFTIRE